jgi:hypothetical protein
LAERIAGLFEFEVRGSDGLLQAIRGAIRRLSRPPKTAWVHRFPEWHDDPLEVGISHDVEPFAPMLRELRQELMDIQTEFDVTIELHFFTQAQLADVNWSSVAPLIGTPMADGSPGGNGDTPLTTREEESSEPPRLNPRSTEFACALASLVNEDLSLLLRARSHLDALLAARHDGNGHDLWEWRKILDTYPLPRLLSFLESSSPRAVRLRQCSPFPAVLTEEEQARLGGKLERPN